MEKDAFGIMVFLGLSVVAALVAHVFVRRYFLASILGAIVATIIFQLFAYLDLGYLDRFWQIAVVTSGLMSLVIAFCLGVPFWYFRRDGRNG